ncbi:LysR family transcriptional regulator [Variovorax sp. J31P207]|uniref:LysR family transcriptional regulator n=1 Tax=Variovorax sp. J31P207 TaxID=3053510 RepID=UPI002575EDBC|nr:LysR family transcriptional regulator [Variovorax sp. J31P207]MDM0066187.1 LysR family transcriptional regulator [Variovorax sp. J31P207]
MDTDSLALISVFVRVARCMSFSGAAAELHISTGTVSRQIARLEKKMGVQLLERSTRRVALTEIGKTFYDSTSHILLLAEESMSRVQDLQVEPRGTLRLTAPMLFSIKHLGPLISRFTERYPHVEVQLKISDQLESLSGGDFDIAVRITNHLDDGVIAKRLTSVHWAVCASPGYLALHGTPTTPAELADHQCYHYPSVIKHGRWSFTRGEAQHNVPTHARFHVNSSQIIADHALAGLGVALLPTYLVGEHLQSGRLVPLLAGYQPTVNSALYALYLPNRYMTAKVHCFLEMLQTAFSDPPYWDAPFQKSRASA